MEIQIKWIKIHSFQLHEQKNNPRLLQISITVEREISAKQLMELNGYDSDKFDSISIAISFWGYKKWNTKFDIKKMQWFVTILFEPTMLRFHR